MAFVSQIFRAETPCAQLHDAPPPSIPFLCCFRPSRLQDGVPSAMPGGRVQGDAALLAVQSRGAAQVLRAAARPRCCEEEVSEPKVLAKVFATTVAARRTSCLQYLPPTHPLTPGKLRTQGAPVRAGWRPKVSGVVNLGLFSRGWRWTCLLLLYFISKEICFGVDDVFGLLFFVKAPNIFWLTLNPGNVHIFQRPKLLCVLFHPLLLLPPEGDGVCQWPAHTQIYVSAL